MEYVTFEEYKAAKNEILIGAWYEKTTSPCECGCELIVITYTTKKNGTFYETNDDGIIEFWSDKHPASRYYSSPSSNSRFLQKTYV